MSDFFITHVEPLHPLQGKEVLFVLREFGEGVSKSHAIVKEIPHHFFTPNMHDYAAEELLANVRQANDLHHMFFEQAYYNGSKSFLIATGSKEDRKILPEPFICGPNTGSNRDPLHLNSPSGLLRKIYPPMMMVDSPDNIPQWSEIRHREYVPLEVILQQPYATIDIETEGWEIGKDHIFMMVYDSSTSQIIFHDLPFEVQQQEGFQLQRYSTQEELGNILSSIIRQEDPLWIYGHNVMNFDQIKIRNLTKSYTPAVNEHHPVTKSAQGLGRVITKGRWTLDTYGYSFNYQNLFANNKLETIASMRKSISYAEQANLVREARQGDLNAFEKLVSYCIGDGVSTTKKSEEKKELVSVKSRHFHRNPDSVCSAGKNTVASGYWKRRHFIIKRTFEDAWKKYRVEEDSFSLDKFKHKFLPQGFERGFHDNVHVVYLAPFVTACKNLVDHRNPSYVENAGDIADPSPTLWELYQNSEDNLERFDILQTLQAELSYIIEETVKVVARGKGTLENFQGLNRKQQAAFHCLFEYHGLQGVVAEDFCREVSGTLKNLKQILGKFEIINQGTYLHFVRGDVALLQPFGCHLGTGDVLSLAAGRVVANPFHQTNINRLVYQGISLDKGRKTNFEKRTLREVVEQIFGGESMQDIHAFLAERLKKFGNGKNPIEDYHIIQNRKTYFKNLLEEVVYKTTVDKEVKEAYSNLKHRIGHRFSEDTQRELAKLMELFKREYAYPYIEEILDEIYYPFPGKVNLVHAMGGGDLTLSSMAEPDLNKYRERVERQFSDFKAMLGGTQLTLGLQTQRAPRKKKNYGRKALEGSEGNQFDIFYALEKT